MKNIIFALFLIISLVNCLKVRGFPRPQRSNDNYDIPELSCAYRPHTTTSCAYSCVAPFLNCDSSISTNGCRINSNTDSSNCGSCGNICTAGSNALSNGCVSGECSYSCNAGFENCDTNSADCETDITTTSNCGSCSNVCTAGDNAAVGGCVTGECTYTCNAGFASCDTNSADCETDITTTSNCGSCNNACSLANATPVCTSGSCLIASCDAGFDNCNSDPSDGCEVNLLTSAEHCNACNNPCSVVPGSNTDPVCNAGSCSAQCSTGFASCDADTADCETDITTTSNCGTCNNACTAGTNAAVDACVLGACTFTCNDGFASCDADASDCETDITTTSNCGTCNNACTAGENAAVDGCVSGACTFTCNAGFASCDADTSDCETDITTTSNCGTCGNVCELPNANEQCSAGECQVFSCTPGFGNCNSLHTDGCEVNLSYDEQNCGACGNICGQNEHCKNGVCIVRHNYDDDK